MLFISKLINFIKPRLLHFRVKSTTFTIVTNNCWGAHIYQKLDIPYQTPFIGTFIAPACYLKLIDNFRWYMSQPLVFIESSRHEHINHYRAQEELDYPIGLLGGDVEIQFLHYTSKEDAANKWARRLARIAPNDTNLFFKFCDREKCSIEQIKAFDMARIQNKVCFVSQPVPATRSTVWIPESEATQVVDGLRLSLISPQYFDAANWLKGGSGKPTWWRPFNSI